MALLSTPKLMWLLLQVIYTWNCGRIQIFESVIGALYFQGWSDQLRYWLLISVIYILIDHMILYPVIQLKRHHE